MTSDLSMSNHISVLREVVQSFVTLLPKNDEPTL